MKRVFSQLQTLLPNWVPLDLVITDGFTGSDRGKVGMGGFAYKAQDFNARKLGFLFLHSMCC